MRTIAEPGRAPTGASLFESLVRRASSWSDRTALTGSRGETTYSELTRWAEAAGAAIRTATSCSAVGVVVGTAELRPLAAVAVAASERAMVPLSSRWPASRIQSILDGYRVGVVVSDASQIPMLSPHGGSGAISIGNELWVVPTGHAAEAVASSEEDAAWQEAIGDLCYLMFSSGSTGVPKGIGMGSEAALRHVDSVIEWLGLTDHDRVFQFAQLSFDTSFEEIWPTLLGGATLVAAPEDILTFKRLTRSLRDHAVTTLQLPTAYWRKWIHALPAEDLDLPWLRQVIIGGEAAFARDAHLWQTGPLGAVPLINSYGPTEAGVTSTAHLVQACAQDSDEPLPIGQPLPGRILRFNERQEGTELLIGGPTLAKGYYADGRFSSDGFLVEGGQRWYRSGDLVASASSELVFVGRCDRQVKMLGHRVDLDSLEAALMVAGAREARVELVLGQDGRDRLVAVVAGAVEDRLIRRRMADHVPAAFVPSVFVRVDSLPLNSSGKIDATACRHLAEDIDVRGNANGILRSPFR